MGTAHPATPPVSAPLSASVLQPQLSTYAFNTNTIRVVEIDGEPWFVAADVCRAIAYATKRDGSVNTWNALRPLADDEVSTAPISGKGMANAKLVSESGLYKITMRSDKPEARAFQDWVTRVVLPAIRKDGGYVMGEEKLATGQVIALIWQIRPDLAHFPCQPRQHGVTFSVPISRPPGRPSRDVGLGCHQHTGVQRHILKQVSPPVVWRGFRACHTCLVPHPDRQVLLS